MLLDIYRQCFDSIPSCAVKPHKEMQASSNWRGWPLHLHMCAPAAPRYENLATLQSQCCVKHV
eukprot:3802876-Amphidinium_carterae.1